MSKKSSNGTWIWVGIVALIIGSIIWAASSGTEKKAVTTADSAELLAVAPDDYIKGNPDATVTLVEYLDFECEACGAYFPVVQELAKAYPNDLKIVTRYFPLPNHRNSMTAALAVEAAGRQGKYWEMHDLLFTEQKNWGEKPAPTPAVFEKYAEQLGLNMEQFKKDVALPEVKARVQRDFDAGEKLGNTGTPTFYLNGKKIPNPNGLEAFKALIDAELGSNVEFGLPEQNN
jgi:protein-disulfide isomerase